MESISEILNGYTSKAPMKRGDYLKLFSEQTGYTIGFIAKKLEGMHDLPTLQYISSVCRQESDRGMTYKHAFDREIKIAWSNRVIPSS